MVSNSFEITSTKVKYPKSIFFIISNEFSERFNYYGMRTILVLYLTRKLNFDDDTSTVIYHVFTSLAYLFPLIGAILADSFLGKFKTITYLSIVYAVGSALIAIGAIPPLQLPANFMTTIGLLCIAIGSGGIKPCVSAFGGDQFKIPEQAQQLATFFSLFYFSINAGSLISTFLTPILREDVHCFGELDCFSLAFGVPAALMIVSIIVFICGKFMYVIKKPSGNVIVLVTKCIGNAISQRSKEKDVNPKEHWLDYAEQKYGNQLVNDIKYLFKILILYIPLPIFWALFDQQGSRWTFQATRMTGEIGDYSIKPDQMQVINPLLILAFIPIFDYAIYPILAKVGIKRPLQKLTLGGILAGVAFIISGFVELALEKTYPIIPGAHESQLRIFNGLPCTFNFQTNIPEYNSFAILPMQVFEAKYLKSENISTHDFTAETTTQSCLIQNLKSSSGLFSLQAGKSVSYFMQNNATGINLIEYEDNLEKDKRGFPLLRVLANTQTATSIVFQGVSDTEKFYNMSISSIKLENVAPSTYNVYVGRTLVGGIDVKLGGVYTLLIEEVAPEEFSLSLHTLTSPNSIHMLWLIPQYVVITAGEVMFSITGLQFSFTQAPESMKSVIQACWLLTVALGNMLVVVIAEAKFVHSQSLEFFLFAGLMLLDMGLFIILAVRYKYVENTESSEDGDNSLQLATSKASEDLKKTYKNDAFIED